MLVFKIDDNKYIRLKKCIVPTAKPVIKIIKHINKESDLYLKIIR